MKIHNNYQLLSNIADVRSGFTFREKTEEVDKEIGNAHIAQIKDVREIWEHSNSSLLIPSQLPLIKWEGKNKAFVESGTVIIPARGSKGGYFRATYIGSSSTSDLPLVVSSQFLVLTPKPKILPQFLCWSLNRAAIQHSLSIGAGSQGTNIAMLNTKTVSQLKLEVPCIETQWKILHLNDLWEQEQKATQALLKNRETMLQGMFQQLLKETS
ncbi:MULTISPECIES: restriction endonuclease subunit S [unclassified Pseudoalteromonas]|jgi:restriction endonuclease S subunit|uniref:restriction endonuclease subunit S n=1 Tax=unclassified Pseudoalteromonas TaxID=194690 RepID=UPI0018F2E271|nr:MULTISPECIES: restriction endonuclease subunit S [unclassified Pseudoalteromonas]MDN3396122.1 restriction endonuclease subunit S [Pseudoalteromonas sp. APC 3215]MDN3471257.1 restriction endonuclease subunit S [Pseudoalteromonas sp. APC 4026]